MLDFYKIYFLLKRMEKKNNRYYVGIINNFDLFFESTDYEMIIKP